jgi:hypothetical protein
MLYNAWMTVAIKYVLALQLTYLHFSKFARTRSISAAAEENSIQWPGREATPDWSCGIQPPEAAVPRALTAPKRMTRRLHATRLPRRATATARLKFSRPSRGLVVVAVPPCRHESTRGLALRRRPKYQSLCSFRLQPWTCVQYRRSHPVLSLGSTSAARATPM